MNVPSYAEICDPLERLAWYRRKRALEAREKEIVLVARALATESSDRSEGQRLAIGYSPFGTASKGCGCG